MTSPAGRTRHGLCRRMAAKRKLPPRHLQLPRPKGAVEIRQVSPKPQACAPQIMPCYRTGGAFFTAGMMRRSAYYIRYLLLLVKGLCTIHTWLGLTSPCGGAGLHRWVRQNFGWGLVLLRLVLPFEIFYALKEVCTKDIPRVYGSPRKAVKLFW
jgi:hypothetical protein